jgi:hypothetical protein
MMEKKVARIEAMTHWLDSQIPMNRDDRGHQVQAPKPSYPDLISRLHENLHKSTAGVSDAEIRHHLYSHGISPYTDSAEARKQLQEYAQKVRQPTGTIARLAKGKNSQSIFDELKSMPERELHRAAQEQGLNYHNRDAAIGHLGKLASYSQMSVKQNLERKANKERAIAARQNNETLEQQLRLSKEAIARERQQRETESRHSAMRAEAAQKAQQRREQEMQEIGLFRKNLKKKREKRSEQLRGPFGIAYQPEKVREKLKARGGVFGANRPFIPGETW